MPVVHSYGKAPEKEKLEHLRKQLEPFKGKLKPRLTLPFTLSKDRKILLKENPTFEDMKRALRSKDFVVRRNIAILKKLPEEEMPKLEELAGNKNWKVRWAVVNALDKQERDVAVPILKRMVKNEKHWEVRAQIANVLGRKGGEEAFSALEKLAEDDNREVRWEVPSALGGQGKKAIPILEKLTRDPDRGLRVRANIELDEIIAREQGKETKIEPNKSVEPNGVKELLLTQKPLFATAFAPELAERIIKIQDVSKQLEREFGSDFTGITVFGSTAKGYSKPGSDLDYSIIAEDERVAKRFRELCKEKRIEPCAEHYISPSKVDNASYLFYGLYFGDHKALRGMQEKVLKKVNKKEWDEIRKNVMYKETDIGKAGERFGGMEENSGLAAGLLRTPPTYEEMLEKFGLQKKNKNQKK